MRFKELLTLLALATVAGSQAQTLQWNKEKFPDFNPTPRIDIAAQRQMARRVAERRAAGEVRPDHWNNALAEAFPPVMNQSAGSCGSASRIYYMFQVPQVQNKVI